MPAHVYILASQRNGTLYTGSTTDPVRRVWEHRAGLTPGFTTTYGVAILVWYEEYDRIIEARIREYAIKRWRRTWKLALIEAMNPDRRDLYLDLNQWIGPLRGNSSCWIPDRLPLCFRRPGKR